MSRLRPANVSRRACAGSEASGDNVDSSVERRCNGSGFVPVSATLGRVKDAFRKEGVYVPLRRYFCAEHPPRLHRRADGDAARADHGDRRRDGHGDPAGPAGRGRLPRRAVHRLAERSAGQQRPAHPDAAADHRGHPPRVPRGGRGHPGDQHVQRERGLAGRLRHGRAELRTELRRRRPGPHGLRRVQHAGAGPATSPARSGRRRGPRRSRRTSTTPAPATSPTTSWSPPTSKRPTAWSTAVPTCSSSRRSSTR